jgi:small subunit ribosomal protein S5
MTESKLQGVVGGIKGCRKVEIEPGFTVHLSNEAEVEVAQKMLVDGSGDATLGITNEGCSVARTSMPSLLLENLPGHITSHSLMDAFKGLPPTAVHLMGGQSLHIKAGSAADALKLGQAISGVELEGVKLHARIAKMGDGRYVVHVGNIPRGVPLDAAQAALESVAAGAAVEKVDAVADTVTLRYSGRSVADSHALLEAVNSSVGSAGAVKVVSMKKPAVVLRCKDMSVVDKYSPLFSDKLKAVRVQLQPKGKGNSKKSLLIGYFSSDADAMAALKALRADHGAAATFKRLAEPTIEVTGLPHDAAEEDVTDLFKLFNPAGVKINAASGSALVTLNSPADVRLAAASMNKKPFVKHGSRKSKGNGNSDAPLIKVATAWDRGCDLGLEVNVPSTEVESLVSQLGGLGNVDKATSPSDVSVNSSYSAFLAFSSEIDAQAAQDLFTKGKADINGSVDSTSNVGGVGAGLANLVTSRLSVLPSFALECVGLDTEAPAAQAHDILAAAEGVHPVSISRSAVLKFYKHADVVPALKALKGIEGTGRAERYRPYARDGDGEYDEESHGGGGAYENFDRWSLKSVMTDYLAADPGLRMQIAKNVFERALSDAKAFKDISWLLENNSSPAIKNEATRLLKAPNTRLTTNRLFELFLQREDMEKFAGDFREMTAFLGAADSSDPFNWSEFKIEAGEDIERLQEAMEAADRDAALYGAVGEDGSVAEKTLKGRVIDGKGGSGNNNVMVLKPEGEGEEEVEVSLEDPSQLTDRDGRVWSGCILNTDTVQKTMPGNRVLTHRALVVIGNMRGAAGFGMGKGQTPPDAINAAFRSALRNLTHIDLFDNYGLAHDLHGKHNSCHAYIKATPRSRIMVASPFASAILSRFGISSASVKIVGRRDPYAQVRAVFNAIGKHENIDEFARDRGQRYLDLRWVYDKNV